MIQWNEDQQTNLSLKTNQQEEINYGRMIVLKARSPHISLGPDYLFTFAAIIMMAIACWVLLKFQYLLHLGAIPQALGLLLISCPPLAFLKAAFSDPGIYNPWQCTEARTRFCQQCRQFVPRKIYHCGQCGVCIQGHDHHCPWLSKCVGRGNIRSFQALIISLPLAFLYFAGLVFTALNP